jgi:hypothetical protein
LANLKKPALLMNQGRTLCKATGLNFTDENDVIAFWVLTAISTFKPSQCTLQNGHA